MRLIIRRGDLKLHDKDIACSKVTWEHLKPGVEVVARAVRKAGGSVMFREHDDRNYNALV